MSLCNLKKEGTKDKKTQRVDSSVRVGGDKKRDEAVGLVVAGKEDLILALESGL
jgi:hypothetical protein